MNYEVGDKIRIIKMNGEPQYSGKEGMITKITKGFLGESCYHGTWGGCSIYPLEDVIELVEKWNDKN